MELKILCRSNLIWLRLVLSELILEANVSIILKSTILQLAMISPQSNSFKDVYRVIVSGTDTATLII